MKNEIKKKSPLNLVLLSGLLLSLAHNITNEYIVEVPDVIAIPWLIISCVLMIIGLFILGKKVGRKSKS